MFNLNGLFGCNHERMTFPQTRRPCIRALPLHVHGTYVVCLKCGSEFRYDWNEMRIGEQLRSQPYGIVPESFSPANCTQTGRRGLLTL